MACPRRVAPSTWAAPLLSLLLLVPGGVQGQERPFPYRLGGRDVALGSLGAVGLGLGAALQGRVEALTPGEIAGLDRASVNGFDRGATRNYSEGWQDVSDWTRGGILAAAGLVTFTPLVLDGRWREAGTLAVIVAEAGALTVGVTTVSKALTERKRPYLYNDGLTPEARAAVFPDSGEGSFSFFSGHAAVSFAAATLLSTTYSDLHGSTRISKLLWVSSVGAATLVSVGRVEGGMHFPTDVLTGAAVGAAIGHLVPRLHRRDAPVVMVVGPGYVGLRWSF
ncbi:MAG: phosphatase PAP2 family protein [Gemmatimonadota bacterium]